MGTYYPDNRREEGLCFGSMHVRISLLHEYLHHAILPSGKPWLQILAEKHRLMGY